MKRNSGPLLVKNKPFVFRVFQERSLIEMCLILLLAVQFQFNSRVGDDWPNSNSASYISWRYGKLTFLTLWNEISYWISAWANGQGRFFPMAVIQVQTLFAVFRTQEGVRFFYGITFVAFCCIWISLIRKLTRNPNTATYFLVSLAFSIQFRRDFEPHIGFGQMLIWAAIWFGLSSHLLIKTMEAGGSRQKLLYGFASGFLYFLSLCQYELTFLMFPVFILFILLRQISDSKGAIQWSYMLMQLKHLISILIATLLYAIIVFVYLRPRAKPDGAYVLGFDIVESPRAFLIQFMASLPLANHPMIETFRFPTDEKLLWVAISMVFLFAVIMRGIAHTTREFVTIKDDLQQVRKLILVMSTLVGVYLMSVPSLMISLQPAWWPRIEFGSTYLGVLFGEIGFSFIAASSLSFIENRRRRKHLVDFSRSMRIPKQFGVKGIFESRSLQLIVLLLAAITFLSNFRMIETTRSRDNLSSSWSTLTREGTFFSDLKNRDFLFSTTFNDAYEINVADVYEKTNIRLAQIFYPPYVWSDYLDCKDIALCPLSDIRSKSLSTLANYTRGNSEIAKLTKQKGFEGDWPSILLRPNGIDSSSFWYFNIFMITESTALAYLVPMEDNQNNAFARTREATLYTMVAKNTPVITPAFLGACMETRTSTEKLKDANTKVQLIKWTLPSKPVSPSGEPAEIPDRIDIRMIETGSC